MPIAADTSTLFRAVLSYMKSQAAPLVYARNLRDAAVTETLGGAAFASQVSVKDTSTTWLENMPAPARAAMLQDIVEALEADAAAIDQGLTAAPTPGSARYGDFSCHPSVLG